MKVRALHLLLLSLSFAAVSCQPDKKLEFARGDGLEKDKPLPDAPEGDSKRFTISTQEGSLREIIGTGKHVFSADDEVYLRSESFSPSVDADGAVHLDVLETASGVYRLLCFPKGSKYWYRNGGENPLDNLVIPYSQFYRSTADSLRYFPLYGEYNSQSSGSAIVFKELISAVAVTVKGASSTSVASVHLGYENEASALLAGVASFDPENGFVLREGVDFVNLNCTDGGKGVALSPEGKTFYLILAPGSYPDGLTLTVTDMSHKGQCFEVGAFDVAAGEVKALPAVDYAPDEDLLFFEHFDNFVWGGNVKGRNGVSSYAPDTFTTPGADRTGSEEAFYSVGASTPGSVAIQSNWDRINGSTVGYSADVTQAYLKSRNIEDLKYMLRCQEYQGCLGVGNGSTRGGIQPLASRNDKEVFYGMTIDFDVCFRDGADEFFGSQLDGSGIATSMTIDGEPVVLSTAIEGNNTYSHNFRNICYVKPFQEETSWHHVQVKLTNMNELSALGLWGEDSSERTHGVFVDNIEIRRESVTHPENKLRVLLYNIQNGMWADQGNNFDNFVAFVKKYDPDVCIFCEAQSVWPTGVASPTGYGKANYFLFKNKATTSVPQSNGVTALENDEWRALAQRFGHSYHAVGAYRDDYPQVVTSRYPITTIKRISSGTDATGKSTTVMHGAGHFQITVEGKTINIVTMHMWPFKFDPSKWENAASIAKLEGYDYARREVETIMNATCKNSDWGDEWLLMGDTNSVSPVDAPYYESEQVQYDRWLEENKWAEPHRAFRDANKAGRQLYDMLREGAGSYYTGEGRFMTSTLGVARMDIMYGSESMKRRVSGFSMILNDRWSTITYSSIRDPESDTKQAKVPSDHRPLLIEFDMSK